MVRLLPTLTVAAFAVALFCVAVQSAPIRIPLHRSTSPRFILAPAASSSSTLGHAVKQRLFLPNAYRPGLKPRSVSFASGDDITAFCQSQDCGSIPLNGSVAYAEYFIELAVGSTRDSVYAQVDTGSSDFAVITDKVKAPAGAHTYSPSKSSTAKAVGCHQYKCDCTTSHQCTYKISYLDGSGFTANVWEDTISLPGSSLMATGVVGGIVQQSKNFEPAPQSGIVGFAYQPVSEIDAPTFMDSLVAGGVPNIFSLCLSWRTNGGMMTIGADGLPAGASVSYTPILQESFYVVNVLDMAVNGKSLGFKPSVYNDGQAVVDSGTTDFLVPQKVYNAMKSSITEMCSSSNLVGVCGSYKGQLFDGYCFTMTESDIDAFPNITVSLESMSADEASFEINVPPRTYLTKDLSNPQPLTGAAPYYCFGIVGLPEGEGTILGDVAMRSYAVVFDRINKRVGFASPDC